MSSQTKSRRLSIAIPVEGTRLDGILDFPARPDEEDLGMILLANASGASRLSPRNQLISHELNEAGFVTLLFDLLTAAEDRIYDRRYDIPLLAKRLRNVTHWLGDLQSTRDLKIGFFGSSIGAAAALVAAAELGEQVCAVVSKCGRIDLAEHYLRQVTAPSLLAVGELDADLIDLTERYMPLLRCEKRMTIIPHATHLFNEPGTLEELAHESADWFLEHVANDHMAHSH